MFVRYEKIVKNQNKADDVTKPKKKRRSMRRLSASFQFLRISIFVRGGEDLKTTCFDNME